MFTRYPTVCDRIRCSVSTTFIDQKNYAIYDLAVVSEIVYRLEVKDKLQHFEQSGRTLSESRSVAKEALEAMDLGAVYINMALQQYEVFCDLDLVSFISCVLSALTLFQLESDRRVYDLKAIIEIIMGLRVLYPPQNNLTSLRPEKQQHLLPSSQSPSISASEKGAKRPPSSGGSKKSSNSDTAPFIVQSPEQRPQASLSKEAMDDIDIHSLQSTLYHSTLHSLR